MATTSNRRSTVERVLRALADEHRRIVLEYLQKSDGSVDLERLAFHVADETDADPSDHVVSLHHAHLPMLEEVGLVRYDPVAGTVGLDDRAADAAGLNALLREDDRHVPGG